MRTSIFPRRGARELLGHAWQYLAHPSDWGRNAGGRYAKAEVNVGKNVPNFLLLDLLRLVARVLCVPTPSNLNKRDRSARYCVGTIHFQNIVEIVNIAVGVFPCNLLSFPLRLPLDPESTLLQGDSVFSVLPLDVPISNLLKRIGSKACGKSQLAQPRVNTQINTVGGRITDYETHEGARPTMGSQ